MIKNGSFYELYVFSEAELNILKKACSLMEIQITRKNKNNKDDLDLINPYMAYIININFDKYIDILMENDFTVVQIDEVSKLPNLKSEKIRIYSPRTYW